MLYPLRINIFLTNVLTIDYQCSRMTNSAFQGGGRLLNLPTALAIHLILVVRISQKVNG